MHKEIVRLCNIGKGVFAPISEAKYNDYVMVHFTGSGESDLDGYKIQTLNIPSAGSVLIPVEPGNMPADLELYLRAVNGSVLICTTDLPATPCSSGYELLQGVTFKDFAVNLNLDFSKSNLQITNPGFTAVTVRAGAKLKK